MILWEPLSISLTATKIVPAVLKKKKLSGGFKTDPILIFSFPLSKLIHTNNITSLASFDHV